MCILYELVCAERRKEAEIEMVGREADVFDCSEKGQENGLLHEYEQTPVSLSPV